MIKVAFCSPFSPVKSGISDFSEELVSELKNHVDIDLFYDTPIENRKIADAFKYYDISKLDDEAFRNQYSLAVYQIGNNYDIHKCIGDTLMKYPGILELHDLSLHHYIASELIVTGRIEEYIDIIRYCHGERGVDIVYDYLNGDAPAPWENHVLDLSVNKHFLDKASGVIVHSDMAKQTVKAIRPDVPVINIPLHVTDIIPNSPELKLEAKRKLSIPEDCYLFGAFGFATKTKRIYQTLEALKRYKDHDFRYVVVGQAIELDIMKEAKRLGIADKVIVTGYTSLEDYKLYMQACDVCINLRYPTNGESSANLQRILGMGIPAVVTDIGAFMEYPDSCVVKVSYEENEAEDILNALKMLTSSREVYEKYSKNASKFIIENASIEKNCEIYKKFFEDVISGTFVEQDEIDRALDKAYASGFTDEEYLKGFVKRVLE